MQGLRVTQVRGLQIEIVEHVLEGEIGSAIYEHM